MEKFIFKKKLYKCVDEREIFYGRNRIDVHIRLLEIDLWKFLLSNWVILEDFSCFIFYFLSAMLICIGDHALEVCPVLVIYSPNFFLSLCHHFAQLDLDLSFFPP